MKSDLTYLSEMHLILAWGQIFGVEIRFWILRLIVW